MTQLRPQALPADSVLWKCDFCGGPAVWTIIRGAVYYHCEEQCDEFKQMELFSEDGVHNVMRGGDAQDAGRATSKDQRVPAEPELPF